MGRDLTTGKSGQRPTLGVGRPNARVGQRRIADNHTCGDCDELAGNCDDGLDQRRRPTWTKPSW